MTKLMTIGAGNMASALLFPMKDLLSEFFAYTPTIAKAQQLATKMGGSCVESLSNLPSCLDYLFLAFKPQQFDLACDGLLQVAEVSKDTVIVSMLAGTPIAVLEEKFKTKKVVRIMPNTPCTTGKGVILTLFGEGVLSAEREELLRLLRAAGLCFDCDSEEQLDTITAVTGSGPAYLFEYARQMHRFLEERGISGTRELVAQLFLGSSELMKESSLGFEELRNNVTSKKGVTFAALESFKEDHWEELTHRGLEKNFARSLELRKAALKDKNCK